MPMGQNKPLYQSQWHAHTALSILKMATVEIEEVNLLKLSTDSVDNSVHNHYTSWGEIKQALQGHHLETREQNLFYKNQKVILKIESPKKIQRLLRFFPKNLRL